MNLLFRQTEPAEADRVRQFLAGVFGTDLNAPALEPRLIRWKYFAPHPLWSGSRSYVLDRGGDIVAHGCVCPVKIGQALGCQIVDWAGSPQLPGSGMLLRRRVEQLVDVALGVGGSDDSRVVMPRAGYSVAGSLKRFVRVVRPLRQAMIREDAGPVGRVGRLARAWKWGSGAPPPPQAWQAVETTPSNDEERYLAECPAAPVRFFSILNPNPVASAVVSEVHGQARVARFRPQSADADPAIRALTRRVAAAPSVCEIVFDTTHDHVAAALVRSGFQSRGEQPVFVKVLRGVEAGAPVNVETGDYDEYYSWRPESHFAS